MARRLFVSALVCLVVSTSGLVGNAQEQPKQSAQAFENPFNRQPLPGKKGEKESKRVENRFLVFASDKVKKLVEEIPADDKLRSLKKERCRVAFVECEARLAEYRNGRAPVASVLRSSSRLTTSLLALEPDTSTRMEILKHNLDIAQQVEKFADANLRHGTGTVQEVALAKYQRLSAEILLEEAKAQLQAKDDASN